MLPVRYILRNSRPAGISLAVIALFALGVTAARAESTTFAVPRHTLFPVLVTKDIRVGGLGAAEQKKVNLELAQDVIVDHHLIAKKGDTVEGHYTNQKNATVRTFSTNISEELALDVDDIINFCGDTIHLQYERTVVGGARTGVLSLGFHSHDAVFAKGSVLLSKSDRVEKNICSERTSQDPLPAPQDGLEPDAQ
jgi:hypothetical protein